VGALGCVKERAVALQVVKVALDGIDGNGGTIAEKLSGLSVCAGAERLADVEQVETEIEVAIQVEEPLHQSNFVLAISTAQTDHIESDWSC